MIHTIITHRWKCPQCGAPLKLRFVPSGFDEDGHSHEVDCELITCSVGCELPDWVTQLVDPDATDELLRALETVGATEEVREIYEPEVERPL